MYIKHLDDEISTLSKKLSRAKTSATKLNKDYTTDTKYNKILKEIKGLKKRKIAIQIGIMKRHQEMIERGNEARTQFC